MDLKKLRSLLLILIASLVGLAIHKTVFYFFVPTIVEYSFIYSIPMLYAFFTIFSVVIVFILMIIKEKSIDNVGYTYLFLTSLKMAIAYYFLLPILELNLPKTPIEKMNFFIIFIYFLAIETTVTIRILNNKQ